MDNDTWECAWRELVRRRSRTVVNMLGYVLAVGVMLIFVAWLQFGRRASDQVLTTIGTNFIVSIPASFCCPGKAHTVSGTDAFVASGVTTELIPESFVGRIKALPQVKDASPYLSFRFRDPKDGHLFTIGGFDPANIVSVGSTTCSPADLVSGAFLAPWDKGVVVLEKAYADSRGLKTGDTVTVAGKKFPVIGIVAPAIRPAKSDIYMHIDDAQDVISAHRKVALDRRQQINVVLVDVKSSKLQDAAIKAVKALDPKLQVSGSACYSPAARVMGMNEKAVVLIMVMIALATLAFSLKSQLSSVIERQRDIGILKAIGWSNKNVVAQVLSESVIQAVLGGVGGCFVAAYVLLFLPVREWSGIQTSVEVSLSPVVFACALALSLLGGMIAGFFPALSAARRNPADALRSM